jgi:hypothetical protein
MTPRRYSKQLLVLFLWRFKLVVCLNYLLQSPAWFEGNLNHLGAGAFEITSRRLPFERVAAADQQTIFDMGFIMADVRPALNAVSAGDQRLVFELLKGHLCLEVSAIAMIDLDQDIRQGLTDPVPPRYSRGHFRGRYVSCT